jgi:ribosomal protein L16 Arg81 hydroxylase
MTLEDILDPISLKTFFTDYWGKQHLILKPDGYHYNIQKFKDIFTFDHLTRYINRYPDVKSLQILDYDNSGTRWCLDKHKQLGQPYFDKKQIVDLWESGKTIVVPFCEYEDKKLVNLCFEFEKYFSRSQVNVYASPCKNSKSFPIHTDNTENFLFHTYGKTKWTLYKEFAGKKPKTILEEIILEEGDLLYIPRHQYHKVETIEPRILFSIHFHNKDNQSLDRFRITSNEENYRDKWFNLNPTKVQGNFYVSND